MNVTTALFVALAVMPTGAHRARYLMGTVCEVAVASEEAAEAAFAEAARIEAMLSTWSGDSELARVNRGETEPGNELRALLDSTLDWSRRTNGAFNPCVKPLVDVWKTRGEGALPDRAAIRRAVRVAAAGISGSGPPAATPRCFEEGAFGKGYALDRMLAHIAAPEAMIDFGGQIKVRGTLRVRVADPERRDHAVLAFTLENASLSTSSGSEQTFTAGGRRFSHIIDPRSGEALPPRGSVSVIADDALSADILSTALYVMGEEDGLRWADANGVAALFIDPKHTIRRSARARVCTRDLELLDRKFLLKE
jgi:thiamine biosynthesis lipoprotein